MNEDVKEKRKVNFMELGESDDEKEESEDDDEEEKGLFINPLAYEGKAKRGRVNSEEEVSEGEWSSDGEEQEKLAKEKEKKKKEKMLGKRKRKDMGDEDNILKDTKFEEVPQENFDEGYSSMDSDDIAETRALAKVMLRKKARNEILDASYNRYSHHDDTSVLPSWFIEDE